MPGLPAGEGERPGRLGPALTPAPTPEFAATLTPSRNGRFLRAWGTPFPAPLPTPEPGVGPSPPVGPVAPVGVGVEEGVEEEAWVRCRVGDRFSRRMAADTSSADGSLRMGDASEHASYALSSPDITDAARGVGTVGRATPRL